MAGRGGVVLLEDQRRADQAGRRAGRLPVPHPEPDQVPGERGEAAPLLPSTGRQKSSHVAPLTEQQFVANSCHVHLVCTVLSDL